MKNVSRFDSNKIPWYIKWNNKRVIENDFILFEEYDDQSNYFQMVK
jgi:hypothetical protein